MQTQADPRFPNPPAEIGVAQYVAPYTSYIILVEKVSTEKGGYKVLNPGDNPVYDGRDKDKYPSPLYLVKITVTPDGKWAFRYWANDRNLDEQDTWNYGIQYMGEDNLYPLYIREYRLPRKSYAPLAKGTTINSPLAINLLTSGTYASTPTVAFIGLTGATASCTIDKDGHIDNAWFTSYGELTGDIADATIYFVGTSGDTDATAQLVFQPADAILIKEEMQELSDDDPLRSRYVRVLRYYATIPGPWFITTSIDEDGIPLYTQRRLNLKSVSLLSETLTGGTWYKNFYQAQDENTFIVWETQIHRIVPGNILYHKDIDPETRQKVTIEQQIVASTYEISDDAGIIESLRPLGSVTSLRLKKYFTSGEVPTARDEYKLIDYEFPCLVTGYTGGFVNQKNGTSFGWINLIHRASIKKKVSARIHTEYFVDEPDPVTKTIVTPQDLIYSGVFFSVAERYCLTDSFTILLSTGSSDPVWGAVVEEFVVSATTPSATAYLAMITAGTEITIGSEVSLSSNGYWKRVSIYIKAE